MRKLVPPILFLICVVLMALLRWLWPLKIVFPTPYNWVGVAFIFAGLLFTFFGVRQFRKAGTNIRPFREADTLVTQGPYRYSRNPMYCGLSVMLVGVWMLLGNLSSGLGVLIFVVVADRWYIQFEEQMLQTKFGVAYESYRSKTRRWL